ncbi:MAG: PAS domain S-box protein [Prochloraceae cyanobacterium]|nr:PAS domain S-box protein [Prochloraceae cyanobacterium]
MTIKPQRGLASSPIDSNEEIARLKGELNRLKQDLKLAESIAEIIPQIVWIENVAGEIVYFSNRWVEYTGSHHNQSYNQQLLATIHRKDRDRFVSELTAAKKQQQQYQTELSLQGSDGRYRPFSLLVKPILDRNKCLDRWVGILTPISQPQRYLENKLEEKEERWQLVLEGIGDGIFDWNIGTNEAFMSPALKAMLGYQDWEIPNTLEGWRELLCSEDAEKVERELQAHLSGQKKQYEVEHRLRCKDGSYKWILARGQAKWDETTGKPIRMVGSHCDISDRKKAEALLKEREAHYRLLAENSTDFISIQTPARIYQYVSPACRNLLGYEPEELINKSIYQFFHPEDAIALQKTYELIGKFPDDITHRYRLRDRAGKDIWVEATDRVVYSEAGAIEQIVSTLRNISDRIVAEQEVITLNLELENRVKLRTAQLEKANRRKDELLAWEKQARSKIQLYADIVSNIQLGLCIWKLENLEDISSFRLVAANPAANKLLNGNLQSCIGQKMTECFPNLMEINREYVEVYAEVVRTKKARELNEIYYSDARIVGGIYAVKAFPLPDNCLGLAFEDITDRKQMERALEESNRQYTNVVNSVREVIFQTDTQGRLTFLNRAWSEITGFARENSLNKPLSAYFSSKTDRKRVKELFQNLIAEAKKSFQTEFSIQTKTGQLRWFEIKSQLDRDSEGKVLGTVGTIDDITERKQGEIMLEERAKELSKLNDTLLITTKELEQSNQELDRFAYVVSHDLKEPLRAIYKLSQWLEEDLEGKLDANTSRQLDLLRTRVERIQVFIDALLEYSRLGRVSSEPERIKIDELIEDIIDSLDPPEDFTIKIDGQMPELTARRLPLQQVFFNLIGNGIKHNHNRNGKIIISSQDKEDFYQFKISDNGPGIDPIYHEKIFMIFKTIGDNKIGKNTGIGLSIVKKNIENHGGTISVQSEIGCGTSFIFTWPKSERITVNNR